MKITLYNSFHNQEITIIPKDIKYFHDETEIYISIGQISRIRKKLCGISDCCCETYSSAKKANGESIKNWDGHLWIEEPPKESLRGGDETAHYR
tara:strand:+ start:167 stop:448 length:282 start_codon:yes stop_codon:yes gene_type:complete